jgi:predicted ArsR family transcriptional regulator
LVAPYWLQPFIVRRRPLILEMPPLARRHARALQVVVDHDRTTTRDASAALGVTRSAAGGALRALELAGLVRGELVGGGELGYSATAAGRAWLEHGASDAAGR